MGIHRKGLATALLAVGLLPGMEARGQAVGVIAGRAVTAEGNPALDAEVRIGELGRLVRVDDDGRFRIESVPPGRYLLEVFSARWGQAIRRVTVVAGQTADATIELVPAVHLDEIVVSAGIGAEQQSRLYQATEVLNKKDLTVRARNTLGETLSSEPGVSSTYSGPGASRPVIRGLSGDRVRVLESGVGSGDASNTSPDHAVSVEPLTADRIEVIRGPATLLYGSAAIGGVVNVLDRRIPRELPTRPVTGTLQATGGTVANERNGALALDGAAGPLAWHASALRRVTGDYEIPGLAESDPGPGEVATGFLENSSLQTTRVALGASYLPPTGFIGAPVSQYDSEYGIPGHEEDPMPGAPPEEPVSIDLRQRRLDVEGAWRFAGPVLPAVKFRFGVADYEHVELEGAEIGTEFLNNSWEGRLEAAHGRLGPLHGAFGVQLANRDFSAIGDEAFVPPTNTDQYAGFIFEELDLGRASFQIGARFERQEALDETAGLTITHSGLSASIGINLAAVGGLSIAVNGSRSIKLPTPEELFSNGPHLATGSFEIGDPALIREVALSGELGVHVDAGPFHGAVTGFVTAFDDYIYQRFTGAMQGGLPELQYAQDDVRFLGVELELEIEALHRGAHHLSFELRGDVVRAELTATSEPLPRIPPARVGGEVRYESGLFFARAGMSRVMDQDRIGAFETPTPAYTLVDASVGYRLFTGALVHELTLRGTNLTDEDARTHTSFFKDIAPLPGRDVSVVYRLTF